MEKKINIAELLKDCPKGMELDCILFNNPVKYDGFDNDDIYPIAILTETDDYLYVTKEGCLYNIPNSKCIIYPKGKTTWEGFHRPFKDGDILTTERGSIFIYKGILYNNERLTDFYCGYRTDGAFVTKLFKDKHFGDRTKCRFATEEEKEKLFQAIKDNVYKWNSETKTLEKLVTDKFDINTLVPFESKVLVRDGNREKWKSNFWGFYDSDNAMNYPYECCGASFTQCIPYEGNEHLLGTTNDCDDFYKTW